MRHEQHVAAQLAWRKHFEQPALLRCLDVAGEQHRAGRAADSQHATDGVGPRAAGRLPFGRRVKPLVSRVAPRPSVAATASIVMVGRQHDGVPVGQRRNDPLVRDRRKQRQRAAGMIRVHMRYDQKVDPRDAARLEVRHQDATAGIGMRTERRAGVVDEHPVLGLDQHRAALPHIERRQPHLAGRRP
jgi:hypothetical protein